MENVYVFSSGVMRKGKNGIFIEKENTCRNLPIEPEISSLKIFSDVSLEKSAVDYVLGNNIPITIFNYGGRFVGKIHPFKTVHSKETLINQLEHYENIEKRIEIAKTIVKGAMFNMIGLLKYYERNGKDTKDEIEKIQTYLSFVDETEEIDALMAYEGNAREQYYHAFNKIIAKEEFKIEKRVKRPPIGNTNAMISLGNTLLYKTVSSQILRTKLSPAIGYLHETNRRSYSLNLDIAEIFKPILVDRIIFRLINKDMIKNEHFKNDGNGTRMTKDGLKKFIDEYYQELKKEINHPVYNRKTTYKNLVLYEAIKIEKHINGIKKYKPYIHKF